MHIFHITLQIKAVIECYAAFHYVQSLFIITLPCTTYYASASVCVAQITLSLYKAKQDTQNCTANESHAGALQRGRRPLGGV
jgi:hypothetical protein